MNQQTTAKSQAQLTILQMYLDQISTYLDPDDPICTKEEKLEYLLALKKVIDDAERKFCSRSNFKTDGCQERVEKPYSSYPDPFL